MTNTKRCPRRRCFLQASSRSAAALALPAWARPAVAAVAASLALQHTHTGEQLALEWPDAAAPPPSAQAALERLLRDHYSGAVGRIDPALFAQLHALQRLLRHDGPWEVISGFRSAETNERLRRRGGGVARNSLHLQGRAIDVRLAGVALAELRDAALSLRRGGVGFYPAERFVHLDTGAVRRW